MRRRLLRALAPIFAPWKVVGRLAGTVATRHSDPNSGTAVIESSLSDPRYKRAPKSLNASAQQTVRHEDLLTVWLKHAARAKPASVTPRWLEMLSPNRLLGCNRPSGFLRNDSPTRNHYILRLQPLDAGSNLYSFKICRRSTLQISFRRPFGRAF